MNLFTIFVNMSDPEITLHGGGPDLHIQHGSQINVSCEIQNYPGPIRYVMWYKGDKVIMELTHLVQKSP